MYLPAVYLKLLNYSALIEVKIWESCSMQGTGTALKQALNMSPDLSDTLKTRLDFIGLDQAALDQLKQAGPAIEAHLVPALERFYALIGTVPAVSRFFDGKPQMDRAKSKQVGHWHAIASGQFDDAYLEASSRVGLRHAKIGLEPRWHIGGYRS